MCTGPVERSVKFVLNFILNLKGCWYVINKTVLHRKTCVPSNECLFPPPLSSTTPVSTYTSWCPLLAGWPYHSSIKQRYTFTIHQITIQSLQPLHNKYDYEQLRQQNVMKNNKLLHNVYSYEYPEPEFQLGYTPNKRLCGASGFHATECSNREVPREGRRVFDALWPAAQNTSIQHTRTAHI